MKYLKYLWYILKHKWYVGLECFKRGLFYQGIVHDLSKFLPSEFFPYAEYFYGKGDNQNEFDLAWLLHQRRNKHHWEYWILHDHIEFGWVGSAKAFVMPLKYTKEMFCDWVGAGKAMGKHSPKNDPYKEAREWYEKNEEKRLINIETERIINRLLRGEKL